jgi:hypothetical protein
MTALVQAFNRATRTHIDAEGITTIALFCCIGLLASFCMMRNGLDFGPF